MKNNQNDNWPLVGNSHIIDFLSRSLIRGQIAGTYIFNGLEDAGKTTLAYYFSQSLLCNNKDKADTPCGKCSLCQKFNFEGLKREIVHSDFQVIKRQADKKNISIEQVREFISALSLTSFSGAYKIGIIKDADSLSIEAANALLKTLEEPRKKVIIILIVEDLEALPQTIVSRSQVLNFYPVNKDLIYDFLIEKHKATRSQAKIFSRLSLGRPALAVKLLKDKDFYNNYCTKAKLFFDFFQKDVNERFLAISGVNNIGVDIKSPQEVIGLLEVWQGVGRDMMLTKLEQKNLIQFEELNQEIEKIIQNLSMLKILNVFTNLERAVKYAKSNVNPKLVLENIALNTY